MTHTTQIRIAFKGLPKVEELNFIDVPTYQNFVISNQLGSGPFHSFGDFCENVYLRDFISSSDFRDHRLVFNDDSHFSDGSPLKAEHFYFSILRLIREGKGVHFNPRRDLEGADLSTDGNCAGLRLSGNEVTMRLKKPNRRLPALLGKIEASILKLSSNLANRESLTQISAGPFRIETADEKKIVLHRNPNYPRQGRIDSLLFYETTDAEAKKGLLQGDFDCCLYSPQLEIGEEESLQKSSLKILRIFGQTYFLSLRNSRFSETQLKTLADLITGMSVPTPFIKSKNLLLGSGLGRLSDEMDDQPKRTSEQKINFSFSIAAVDSMITRSFADHLTSQGAQFEMIWVKSFTELYRGESLNADFILAHNDFAGRNPYIAFYNSLNPDRPLILDDKSLGFRSQLMDIENLETLESKDQAYQNLHKDILRSHRVIPYAAKWDQFLCAPNLELFQEAPFALWKAKPANKKLKI